MLVAVALLALAVVPTAAALRAHRTDASSAPGGGAASPGASTAGAPSAAAPASFVVVTDTTPGASRIAGGFGSDPGGTIPAAAGNVYTGSASVKAATTARRAQAVLGFFSADGTALGSAWGQPGPDSTSWWTRTVPAVGVAPPGTQDVKLGVFFYGTAVGETHYAGSPSLTSRPGGSPAVDGPLHTSGRTIYDAHGHPVVLRGVVSDWLQWHTSAPAGSPLDDHSVGLMKQWGANTVRVMLTENYWNSHDCAYSPGYAAAVDQVVSSITSRGMVALLNLHSNGRTPCDNSGQQRMADDPGSVSFWTSVANRYKTNPLVAFDLYNEPHDITWDQWLNGGKLTDTDGVTWQAAGMIQLYKAVRGTGATNLVFVSSDGWAQDSPPPGYLVSGSNIVYAMHAYTCMEAAPPACQSSDPYDVPSTVTPWAWLIPNKPVVVTEFGWPTSDDGSFNRNVVQWAAGNGLGWMVYDWTAGEIRTGTTPHFGILGDSATGEPDPAGMTILQGLGANSSSRTP